MAYEPENIFGQYLKRYIYFFSFQKGKLRDEDVDLLFGKIVDVLNEEQPQYHYGYSILPNPEYSTKEIEMFDIFLSYNPEFLINERALVNLVRSELMQAMK